jgi:hypothetical protein
MMFQCFRKSKRESINVTFEEKVTEIVRAVAADVDALEIVDENDGMRHAGDQRV